MKFTYSSGQRPLEGYTIKRGVGTGGFGEVYYALSDGGKEVALKLVRGQQDIELRGIAQCLNLKHPHLVALYDMKTDSQADHWVIMEYVAGEPLNVVLNRHPSGLPVELAQQWFEALARAVAYLHDHGIVHRDLKPGNIFIENGSLKVGDYGLSKFISSSARTAQTQSVGTVYYMAPEISTGNYNKQIDIYAAGIILYEMLTGKVPFEGESAGEILMKHLTTPPDLSKVPAPYVPIVARALAKNPAQRYTTITEMARDVEALNGSVNAPAPNRNAPVPPPVIPMAEEPTEPAPPVSFRGQLAELSGSLALAAVLSGLLAILYGALARVHNWTDAGQVMFLTLAVCWSVLIPAKFWNSAKGDPGMRRVIMMILGACIGVAMLWLQGRAPFGSDPLPFAPGAVLVSERLTPAPPRPSASPLPALESTSFDVLARYICYFALPFLILRWWKMADRNRTHRFSCFPVIAAGFWATILHVMLWPEASPFGAIALVTAAVIIQWVSPWEQPPPKAARRLRLRYA